jgi:hypothetical protein
MNKGLMRDCKIGDFEIDIPKVYGMAADHTLQNRWIAMNDPDGDNISEIKAYLRISIAIQGPNDNAVRL